MADTTIHKVRKSYFLPKNPKAAGGSPLLFCKIITTWVHCPNESTLALKGWYSSFKVSKLWLGIKATFKSTQGWVDK